MIICVVFERQREGERDGLDLRKFACNQQLACKCRSHVQALEQHKEEDARVLSRDDFINKTGFNNNSDNNNHSPSTFTERFGLNSGFTIQNVEKKKTQRVQD